MPKIVCAAIECVHQDKKKNICRAKVINLSENFVHTVHDGQKQFWTCRTFEKDPEISKMDEKFLMLMKEGEKD